MLILIGGLNRSALAPDGPSRVATFNLADRIALQFGPANTGVPTTTPLPGGERVAPDDRAQSPVKVAML